MILTENKIYTGDFESHNFPSEAKVVIEIIRIDGDPNTIEVKLSSSDGAGSTSNATAVVGNGNGIMMWIVHDPILFGTGWGASFDQFTSIEQQRLLIVSEDGSTATYQDMGIDIARLSLVTEEEIEDEFKTPSSLSSSSSSLLLGNTRSNTIAIPFVQFVAMMLTSINLFSF